MARKFRGSEEVKVDAKGRVSIPARFRRVFEAADPDWKPGERPQLVIVYGPKDWTHLRLYTMDAINEIDDEISRMRRGSPERTLLETIMNGYADEAEIDGDGRLVLPARLREKIGLTDTIFFLASGDHIRAWATETYRKEEESMLRQVPDFDLSGDPLALLSRDEARV